jgi:hypothetical protein
MLLACQNRMLCKAKSAENEICRISEDVNSGNVEGTIRSVIVYATTTVTKVEIFW